MPAQRDPDPLESELISLEVRKLRQGLIHWFSFFLACALTKGDKRVKELKKIITLKKSRQKTYPGTRIIGGSVDIAESPEEGGEFCRNYTLIMQAGCRCNPKQQGQWLFLYKKGVPRLVFFCLWLASQILDRRSDFVSSGLRRVVFSSIRNLGPNGHLDVRRGLSHIFAGPA